MSGLTRNLQKQARKRGQTVVFISQENAVRCPCWNETYDQPDAAWHEANPTEPLCNAEGYLPSPESRVEGHAFVIPYEATSRSEISMFSHHIERLGPVLQNDHLLIAPSLPANTKRIEWAQRQWHVFNQVPVYVGNEVAVWLALVRSA